MPMLKAVSVAVVAAALLALPARAENLTVSQYGRIAATLPWAVALKTGMFKQAGLDIDAITASAGGGTSLRNMLAGKLPFAEAATSAVIAGVKTGLELKVVMATSNHIGELSWAAKPGSGVTSIKDLAGKKIAFSSPRSITEMVVRTALAREGLTGKVEALSLGGLGPALTALAQGAIAAAPLNDPALTLEPQKYTILFHGYDYYPQFTWAVGVTTREFAEKSPQTIKALVQVRRKAVDYMYAHRPETAKIYAEVWQISESDAEKLLPKYYDWGHWSHGEISPDGLKALVDGMISVGELDKPFDWSNVIDQSFLDPDLRRKL
jgi:NitT/TauT family transport system substrate-binding protein